MKKLFLPIPLLGLVIALLPAEASAHGFKKCGHEQRFARYAYVDARAHKVPCREARAVARFVAGEHRRGRPLPKRFRIWRRDRGDRHWTTWKCVRKRQRYGFRYFSCIRRSPRKGHQHLTFYVGYDRRWE